MNPERESGFYSLFDSIIRLVHHRAELSASHHLKCALAAKLKSLNAEEIVEISFLLKSLLVEFPKPVPVFTDLIAELVSKPLLYKVAQDKVRNAGHLKIDQSH